MALCFLSSVNAQDTIQNNKIYRTWITLNSEPFKTNGALYEIKDSSILVSNSLVIRDYSAGSFETANLHINDIETIKVRRKNRIGRGVLFGALGGFALGGIIGLASGDDPDDCVFFCASAGEKALIAGIPLSITGAGLGALIGSFKIKIPINGNISNFNKNKQKLRKYAFRK